MKSRFEELLDVAYENLRLSSLIVIGIATVLLVVFFGHVENSLLFIWYFFVVVVSGFRFVAQAVYKKQKKRFTIKQWKNIFSVALLSIALLFGITPFLFFIQESPAYQMILFVIIAGLTAGGASSFASMRKITQVYLVIIIFPLIIELVMQNTLIYYSLAFLTFIYLVLLIFIVNTSYRNYFELLNSKRMYQKEKEKFLLSQEHFQAVFRQAPLGIFMYDTKFVIQEVNQEFTEFLEAPMDFLIGLNLTMLPDTRILPAISVTEYGIEGFYEGEYNSKYKNKDLWISMHTSPLKDTKGEVIGGIGIVADITQRMRTQMDFEHQAKYDTLTNIPNRTFLLEKMAIEISRYKRHTTLFGLLFLDLDHFKNVNDSLGHAVGDKLLVKTAQRLGKIIREGDTLARLGGDEFIILLADLGTEEHDAARKAEVIAQKIHTTLQTPFVLDKHTLSISSSIGVAIVGEKNEDIDDLLKHADIAMYEAKKMGRNTTKFYKLEMDSWISRRVSIENGLRSAIENGELELYYQPIVEFSTSNIIGAEALLRWNTTKVKDVFPDEFIPIAEESGLIFEIGKWVLENALRQFMQWRDEFKDLDTLEKIAVNISAHQFDNTSCVADIASTIKTSKIPEGCLDLELVESALVANVQSVQTKMQEFRDLGVGISIDDFGTGYSSLSYLKKLPFTKLKIDKSFTMDIQDDVDDKELISAILMIAQTFDFEVVAEGVETYEQYLFLKEKNCKYMQGYLCSKPLSAVEFAKLLRENGGKCTLNSNL
ncbi:EAL domain-containing protein [Sulfurimonas sp.]|uniref:putative bifunctional diguanylate cyclase/phosphodiesterase n=1 Tax=Sulfurimonas sp. TaxID=2022749 RepID=UPI00262FB18C|nr:EAL domain-containing protein [Sulfurimonas sp.]